MTHAPDNSSRPEASSTKLTTPATPTGGGGKPKSGDGSSLAFWILVTIASLILVSSLLALLTSSTELRGRYISFTQEDWGAAQSIRYVGTLGPTTQVETERRIFLLRGIANLDKGARLVRRKDFFGQQICIAGSNACWELLGN